MAKTHSLTLPGAMLERGFWLYVWRVQSPRGELLYVGRTGDNSSPFATAPYTRMGQHLGTAKNQNALRTHLLKRGIDLITCSFELIAHGPIYPEVIGLPKAERQDLMNEHMPYRNWVGAMEKALAEELKQAGYDVLNQVQWSHDHDPQIWKTVRAAFADVFTRLK